MTFEAFKGYVSDVLARLVIVCIQKHQPVERAAEIMTWATWRRRCIGCRWGASRRQRHGGGQWSMRSDYGNT
jgi:hypothetical protein